MAYTPEQMDSWINGQNGQGRSAFTGLDALERMAYANTGKYLNAGDYAKYGGMIEQGQTPEQLASGLGWNKPAQEWGNMNLQQMINDGYERLPGKAHEGGRGHLGRQAQTQVQPAAPATPNVGAIPSMGYPGANPWLQSMIGSLGQQYGQQYQRNILPAIDHSYMRSGGYGGAKNGVAEGVAAGDSMTGFANAAMGLLGNDWTQSQNRQLTDQAQKMGFYSNERANDRADLQTGASLVNNGAQGPWMPLNNANNIYGNYTGFGNTTSQQGGGLQGAVGGALSGASLAKSAGWW